jgi:putative ABC transport system ATP-binding protein
MGPSGCGKTTLLNCLSGLDDLTDGRVLIEGQDIHAMKDNKRTDYRARNMGFIFQSFNLLPVLTAVENVELPLLVTGIRLKEARKKAETALELVDLSEWKNHKPSELSGGQRQRVTIARSLVNEPNGEPGYRKFQ